MQANANLGERKPIIIGDFNLNEKYDHEYSHQAYYDLQNEAFEPLSLFQVIDFHTCTRNVNGTQRSSKINHVYVTDLTMISKPPQINTAIGDH